MNDHVYKSLELTGSSKLSSDDAVKSAIKRASKTIHDLKWFEVLQVRGHIDKGKVEHWQATIKVGFRLQD